jgi:CRISPR-associated protein Csy3
MAKDIPNMLNYERSVNPTDALLTAESADGAIKKPVLVTGRGIRTTFSNASEKASAEKGESKGSRANLQRIELATLPTDTTNLIVSFGVSFVGRSTGPLACNSEFAKMRESLKEFSAAYRDAGGYTELARRYIGNIVSGRFLWRNRSVVDQFTVEVKFNGKAHMFENSRNNYADTSGADDIVNAVAEALADPLGFVQLQVRAIVPMHELAEVFPSQVFDDNAKGKVLSSVRTSSGDRQAIMHNQKIGNALRTIDDWYQEDAKYPLPVEPFGIDRSMDYAWRIKNGNDFYTLMVQKLDAMIAAAKKSTLGNDEHFFAACLVRGGVFSAK